eukprot:5764473-Pyramimonas_sp.AAC.1
MTLVFFTFSRVLRRAWRLHLADNSPPRPRFLFPWHSASAAVEWVYIVDGEACQHKVLTPKTRALTGIGPEE